MADRLGDGEVAHAIFDALNATTPGVAPAVAPRESPFWIEAAWNLSESGLMIVRKGADDV